MARGIAAQEQQHHRRSIGSSPFATNNFVNSLGNRRNSELQQQIISMDLQQPFGTQV
jgi:hypothetical protein